jgi:hypothetical protein
LPVAGVLEQPAAKAVNAQQDRIETWANSDILRWLFLKQLTTIDRRGH